MQLWPMFLVEFIEEEMWGEVWAPLYVSWIRSPRAHYLGHLAGALGIARELAVKLPNGGAGVGHIQVRQPELQYG